MENAAIDKNKKIIKYFLLLLAVLIHNLWLFKIYWLVPVGTTCSINLMYSISVALIILFGFTADNFREIIVLFILDSIFLVTYQYFYYYLFLFPLGDTLILPTVAMIISKKVKDKIGESVNLQSIFYYVLVICFLAGLQWGLYAFSLLVILNFDIYAYYFIVNTALYYIFIVIFLASIMYFSYTYVLRKTIGISIYERKVTGIQVQKEKEPTKFIDECISQLETKGYVDCEIITRGQANIDIESLIQEILKEHRDVIRVEHILVKSSVFNNLYKEIIELTKKSPLSIEVLGKVCLTFQIPKETCTKLVSKICEQNCVKLSIGYCTKDYLEQVGITIKEYIDKHGMISVDNLSKNIDLPNKDIVFIVSNVIKDKDIFLDKSKTKIYTNDYIINEIKKLFMVYEELSFEKLIQKFGLDRTTIEKILVVAIYNRVISAKIKGDLVIATREVSPVEEVVSAPALSVEDLTKTVTLPNYRILEPIGRGGFSTVFKAKDTQGRLVALKMFSSLDKNMKRTFTREVSLWKVLEHPNIVKLIDFGIEPIPFIAMELMDGTLRSKMNERKFSIKEALDAVLQMSLALDYAHRDFNLVHRDIKPENILYKEDMYKLSDWGLAGIQNVLSLSTGYTGTIAYSAPEQFDANIGRIGPWTDVWQLGAVLYELLSGRTPFGKDIGTVVRNVLYGEPDKIEDINPDLWSLIEDMLNKNPKDRPTVTDIIKRIRMLLPES